MHPLRMLDAYQGGSAPGNQARGQPSLIAISTPSSAPAHRTRRVRLVRRFPSGNVNNLRIQKFTGSGTFVTMWNANSPLGVAVDPSGNVYVSADSGNSRIQKFVFP